MFTFLSTPSARRATSEVLLPRLLLENFYPRPPRGGRHLRVLTPSNFKDFYPRPPRGGRPLRIDLQDTTGQFLSTPSARRATRNHHTSRYPPPYFYPRPPRGGRLCRLVHPFQGVFISIHALREEGDAGMVFDTDVESNFYPRPPRGGRQMELNKWQSSVYFYPRPPRGGRPCMSYLSAVCASISIHALREEGDAAPGIPDSKTPYFYPRPPRGGRLGVHAVALFSPIFLSTPSARRATNLL